MCWREWRLKFSKVRFIVILSNQCSRELPFEIFYPHPRNGDGCVGANEESDARESARCYIDCVQSLTHHIFASIVALHEYRALLLKLTCKSKTSDNWKKKKSYYFY